MKYIIYKLKFLKGFRTGQNSLEETGLTLKADTIYSAIINEISRYSLDLLETIIEETRQGGLLFSDGFPYNGEELMLPKPLISIGTKDGDSKEKKKFKKIKYIPLSQWENYVKGESDPDKILKINEAIGKKQLDTKISYRPMGDHEIYNLEYYRFNKSSGLYFILGYEEEELLQRLDQAMKRLSYTGIGGKKSLGLGRFEIEKARPPQKLLEKLNTEKSNMILTTSMAKDEELSSIINPLSRYTLEKRSGYIYSENKKAADEKIYKKENLYFFGSGSVFNEKYEGDLFRIDKGFIHPVYRYSKPIWMEV